MKNKNSVFRIILKSANRYKLLSCGILITVLGAVGVSLLPPLVLGEAVDRLSQHMPLPVFLILMYFALTALTGILESLRESLLIVFGQKITHALRSEMSNKLCRLSTDSLIEQEPGAVVASFVGDVNTVETLFSSGIISMFADSCRLISILFVVWIKNRGLALLLLLILPLIFAFTRAIQKNTLKAQLLNRSAVSKATNLVPESIRCLRTIHTLGKEAYMENRYDDCISQSYKASEKTNFYDSVYSPVILVLNAVIVAVLMLLSASGEQKVLTFFGMSAGTAVALINYISQVFSPLESLGMEIQAIQSAAAGVKRIDRFLSKTERCESSEKLQPVSSTHCVELRNVSFGYEEKNVLENLSFTVEAGEQLTLEGRTGAGKSTVLKLLLGLYRPDSGEVLVKGMEASDIPDSEKRKIFGFVEQTIHPVPGTVREQITLFDQTVTDEMAERAAEIVGLDGTIRTLEQGYDTPFDKKLFSQGQLQLLSIARAVAAEPEILLLDEITANLDAETEKFVLSALSRASAERTVISVSHRVYSHSGGRVKKI